MLVSPLPLFPGHANLRTLTFPGFVVVAGLIRLEDLFLTLFVLLLIRLIFWHVVEFFVFPASAIPIIFVLVRVIASIPTRELLLWHLLLIWP